MGYGKSKQVTMCIVTVEVSTIVCNVLLVPLIQS